MTVAGPLRGARPGGVAGSLQRARRIPHRLPQPVVDLIAIPRRDLRMADQLRLVRSTVAAQTGRFIWFWGTTAVLAVLLYFPLNRVITVMRIRGAKEKPERIRTTQPSPEVSCSIHRRKSELPSRIGRATMQGHE